MGRMYERISCSKLRAYTMMAQQHGAATQRYPPAFCDTRAHAYSKHRPNYMQAHIMHQPLIDVSLLAQSYARWKLSPSPRPLDSSRSECLAIAGRASASNCKFSQTLFFAVVYSSATPASVFAARLIHLGGRHCSLVTNDVNRSQ